MQALGLIETRGLIAAIEAADTMAKSAEVKVIEKTYVGGGLVTITIEGDVGAVKASVDSGVAAVMKLGEGFLVSEHVIPRPHYELESIIGKKDPIEEVVEVECFEEELNVQEETLACEDEKESEITEELVVEEEQPELLHESSSNEEESQIEIQEESQEESEEIEEEHVDSHEELDKLSKISLENIHKEEVDNLVINEGLEKAISTLSKLKVVKLRNLAREYDNFPITGRVISKAGKKTLITKFKAHYEKK